jgi:DNA-binding XRE family transcriptional regulator
MARTLDQVLTELPAKRRARIERRAVELATTLKDLREAFAHTQVELAQSLGVGQDTISRIERRSDMLLSTLRRYVEAMGGRLELVARFPNRSPLLIEQLATSTPAHPKAHARGKVRRVGKRVARPVPSETGGHLVSRKTIGV